jgi:UDP-4-amino-4,6-dideoxy-N-acetyl-beta-L-altrosamine transaminase
MSKIPYGKQSITEEDIQAVEEVLRSDFLTQGPKVQEFEEAFARYVGAKFAVAVANGTAALHLSALSLTIQPGQKVITTPMTFAASANCVQYCGGEIFFCDIDPETQLLDINQVQKTLESYPPQTFAGIIAVDYTGYPVDLESFRHLADDYDLWLLEDACHAPGGYFIDSKGQKRFCGDGNLADAAIFSFHPVKHIAAGEGGMITTNNPDLYQRLQRLRTHGITKNPELLHENHGGWYYELQELGYNYRLTDMQAALGLSQLSKANNGLETRHQIASKYDNELAGIGDLILPSRSDNTYHGFHLYVIRTSKRKALFDYLRTNDILVQVHYIPVHLFPYYKEFGWKQGDCPNAEEHYEKCLTLPMYPSLGEKEQDFVIQTIRSFFDE